MSHSVFSNLTLRLQNYQEERSNGKCGQEFKKLSLTCKPNLLIPEFLIDHLSKLTARMKMNGSMILQLSEERSNGKDITIAILHISIGLQEPTHMSQDNHILEVQVLLKSNIVEIPQQIGAKSNGLYITIQRPTRTLTGTPTYPLEDHTTELLTPKMTNNKNGLLIHQLQEARNSGKDMLELMLVILTGLQKLTEMTLEFHTMEEHNLFKQV